MKVVKSLVRPFHRAYRRARRIRQQQNACHQQIAALRANHEPVRLIIGAGYTAYSGWIVTDLPYLDVLNPDHWARILGDYRADRVLAEHVFEHLTPDQFSAFLRIARAYIAPEGFIRIAVPDGYHPDPDYIDYVRPGGKGRGAADHKVLYNHDSMIEVLARHGYAYRLLEYFDAEGQFHRAAWDMGDGMIKRSAEHDERNRAKPLAFTSLIVDFWPA